MPYGLEHLTESNPEDVQGKEFGSCLSVRRHDGGPVEKRRVEVNDRERITELAPQAHFAHFVRREASPKRN